MPRAACTLRAMARLSERGLRKSVGVSGHVRDGLRQRRLLDLLRARPRRRARARPHAARVPVRRRAVRADGENLRRGRLDVPRSRRLLLVRAPRLQRRRLVLRRLGAQPRLHPHDRDLGVLRAPLPERVPRPRRAQAQPRRHRRRPDRGRDADRAEHPRPRRVGAAELRPRDRRPVHADPARGRRRRARAQPLAARQPGPPRHRRPRWTELVFALSLAMLAYTGIETVANMAEEARDPGKTGAQGRQPRRDRGARRLRRHLGRRAVGAAGDPPRRRLQPGAETDVQRTRLRDRARPLLRKRPGARGDLAARPARHGAETRRILRRHPRRDDPVHRHERRA